MSNQPPIGVPQGAIRLNTDSQKLEFFAQDRWYEMATHSDVFDGGAGRALIFRGGTSDHDIDFINIESAGNATDFGTTHHGASSVSALGDRTRCLCVGGGAPSFTNQMQFFTIASTGIAAIDFGDLTRSNRQVGHAMNSTRSVMPGGYDSSGGANAGVNTIDYVTTQTTGNALDFGDLTQTGGHEMASSPTRGVSIGGYGGPNGRYATNEFITTHTLGNGQEFGELPNPRNDAFGVSNSTRGIFLGGGQNSPLPDQTDAITFVELATLGNATNFGNLIQIGQSHAGASNKVRAVKTNGYIGSPVSGTTNRIEYVNIATGGEAIDFGDATYAATSSGAHSNAGGGL